MLFADDALLATRPPAFSASDVVAFANRFYDLDLMEDVVALGSERDQNFLVTTRQGKRFVFKISNIAETDEVISLQTETTLHLQRSDPSLPIQHLVPTIEGKARVGLDPDEGGNTIRLYTFLEGQPLARFSPHTPQQRYRTGQALGRMAAALRGFSHAHADHDLMWNLAKAGDVEPLLERVPDRQRRDLALRCLQGFRAIEGRLQDCRAQVIHNDLNPHNILFDGGGSEVTGILDLGDVMRAPIVFDVAVAAAPHQGAEANPLDGPGDVIAGFHSVFPLTADELDIMFDLIAARLVMNVAITGWRASRFPENALYILKNNEISWRGLEAFQRMDRAEAGRFLRSVCQTETAGAFH